MSRSLYICYFGVREPLVQTQVIPYLRELVKGGHEMSLVTFEGAAFSGAGSEENIKTELAEQGIDWHWLKYHKRFSVLATAKSLPSYALITSGASSLPKLPSPESNTTFKL